MNLFGRGRGASGDEPPRVPPAPSGPWKGEDSFLTGDERTDTRKIQMLLATIAELNSTVDVEQLLVSLVDKAIAVAGAERGILLLREGPSLTVKVARDSFGNNLPATTRFSTKITTQAESTGEPVRDTVDSNAKALELSQSIFDLKIRTVMCVPLCTRNQRTLGVIYVDSRVSSREFSPADLKFFAAFATQATIALENAQLLRDSIEKERMSQELRIARQIQMRMLPREPPVLEGYEIAAVYEAASETAGDSYDFMLLPGGRLSIVVTDVSGHGVGPALVAMSSRARLRTYLESGLDIGDALTRLNDSLCEEVEDGLFQTVFVGLLDPAGSSFRYVNAGHPPPLCLRASDGSIERLTKCERALALSGNVTYRPSSIGRLAPGDVLLAYTDGLVEARPHASEEFFAEARVEEWLRSAKAVPMDTALGDLLARVRAFAGSPLDDDVTLVGVRAVP